MKRRVEKKSAKKSGSKKSKLEEWLINIFAITLLGGGMVFIIFMSANQDDGEDPYLTSLPPQQDTIAHSKICMVDDIYPDDYPAVHLSLATKIYYGCDAKAIQSLTSKPEVRSALTQSRIENETKHRLLLPLIQSVTARCSI